jgi:hypothetical protein
VSKLYRKQPRRSKRSTIAGTHTAPPPLTKWAIYLNCPRSKIIKLLRHTARTVLSSFKWTVMPNTKRGPRQHCITLQNPHALITAQEQSSDLDTVSWVPYLRAKLAEKVSSPRQKYVSMTLHWGPFIRCSVYNKPRAKFMHSLNQTKDNRKSCVA